jgi:integrase
MHAAVRVILAAAIDDGLIVANPAAGLGKTLKLVARTKQRQKTIKAFDRAQRDLFLTTARAIEPWWAPMWEVQALCGLRPGELYALEEDDLDLEARTARIVRTLADDGASVGTCKSGAERTIDLSARAVQELRAHLTTRKAHKLKRAWPEMPEPFFCSQTGTHPDLRNVRDAFARVVKRAKLSHATPHGLRHTFASLLLVAGVDVYYVSRMLGHASISETVDTYGRWLPANRPGALDVLDGPSESPEEANA